MNFRNNRIAKRLSLTLLEDRTNPAFALTIADVAASIGIAPSVVGTTTTLTATATGATLDVDDLFAAIQTGDVVISSGIGGGETGEITINTTLDFVPLGLTANRSLTIQSGPDSTAGNVVFGTDPIDGATRVALTVDTTAPLTDGDIDISGPSSIFEIRTGSFNAGAGTLSFFTMQAETSIAMTGGLITGTNLNNYSNLDVTSPGSTITLNGPYTSNNTNGSSLAGNTTSSTITVNGTINGTAEFNFRGTELNLNGNVGTTVAPAKMIFQGVNVKQGANSITATTIEVTDNGDSPGFLGDGSGPIVGDVNVQFGGYLAPGGTAVGSMNIVGNVSFDFGGGVDIDFGPGNTNDQISVGIGHTIDLTNGTLGGPSGTGAKTGTAPGVIINAESVVGTFDNAPDNTTVIVVSQEAVTADVTTSTVELAAAAAGLNTVSGYDADGTRYTARLTGPGQLVTIPNAGKPSFVLRNTTATSAFTVTTTANASDLILLAGSVAVAGPFGALNTGTTDYLDGVSFGSSVRTVKTRHLSVPLNRTTLRIGGTAANLSAVTVGNVEGEIRSGSTLSSLTLKDFSGRLTAPRIVSMKGNRVSADITVSGTLGIGTLTTTQDLNGSIHASVVNAITVTGCFGTHLNAGNLKALTVYGDACGTIDVGSAGPIRVTGGIDPDGPWNFGAGATSITAGSIEELHYTGGTLGSLSVIGNAALDLPADLVDSTFHLLGNNGAALGRYGLKTALIKGNVVDSTFHVREGNVLSFTTGRFIRSKLYLDYTPGDPFNTAGAFDSATAFKLASFTTTAVELGIPTSPQNFSFADSEVVADTLGTTRISSLKTGNTGDAHGFKFRTAGGTLRVTKSSDLALAAIPLNTNLTPSVNAIGGGLSDFFYRDV